LLAATVYDTSGQKALTIEFMNQDHLSMDGEFYHHKYHVSIGQVIVVDLPDGHTASLTDGDLRRCAARDGDRPRSQGPVQASAGRRGEIKNFTGVDQPYEAPEALADRVIKELEDRGRIVAL
jgi:hypothetical protein